MPSPQIKIFDASGLYQASTHDYCAAAALMGLYGEGATVRLGHSKKETVWTEGMDGSAADCYELIADAIDNWRAKQRAVLEGMLG